MRVCVHVCVKESKKERVRVGGGRLVVPRAQRGNQADRL